MKKKRIIVIVCVVLAVVLAAGGFAAYHFYFRFKPKTPNLRDTPIPMSIRVEPVVGSDTPDPALKDGLQQQSTTEALLFGKTYPVRMWQTEEKYKDRNGILMPVTRWTEYLDESGAVKYTYIICKEWQAVYDADGTIVCSSDTFIPKTDFTAEPMRWFYKDGKVLCGELGFYNDEDNGCAYYDAEGKYLGAWTQSVYADKQGNAHIDPLYFDADFVVIEREAFDLLMPQPDVPEFMQFNWE